MVSKRVPRTYPVAKVIVVHDADTLRLDVDQGFGGHQWEWIRLKDVHAPELSEPGGPAALDVVLAWLTEHAPDGYVSVDTFWTPGAVTEIRETRTFIRYVGVVRAYDEADLNAYLIGLGYIDQGM
jgi:hypothetical protein